jgi:hypothetical protein
MMWHCLVTKGQGGCSTLTHSPEVSQGLVQRPNTVGCKLLVLLVLLLADLTPHTM